MADKDKPISWIHRMCLTYNCLRELVFPMGKTSVCLCGGCKKQTFVDDKGQYIEPPGDAK